MIGVWAAMLGGRAPWLVPMSFVTVMALGGALGMFGMPLPFAEALIVASIVGLAALIAFKVRMPIAASMALAAFFAVAHGHAHGSEMPDTVSGLAYGLGFVIATAALHGAGLALGRLLLARDKLVKVPR
jgi:urease accessory protein